MKSARRSAEAEESAEVVRLLCVVVMLGVVCGVLLAALASTADRPTALGAGRGVVDLLAAVAADARATAAAADAAVEEALALAFRRSLLRRPAAAAAEGTGARPEASPSAEAVVWVLLGGAASSDREEAFVRAAAGGRAVVRVSGEAASLGAALWPFACDELRSMEARPRAAVLRWPAARRGGARAVADALALFAVLFPDARAVLLLGGGAEEFAEDGEEEEASGVVLEAALVHVGLLAVSDSAALGAAMRRHPALGRLPSVHLDAGISADERVSSYLSVEM